MNRTLFSIIVGFALGGSIRPAEAGCGHFFKQHHVVAPAVIHQNIFYSVGESVIRDAAIAREVQRQLAELKGQQPGTLQQTAPATSVLSQRCARCHTGESARGGVRLDGAINAEVFQRSMEILSGVDVPDEMKGVVAGLQQSDFPALMSEMLGRKPKAEAPGVLR